MILKRKSKTGEEPPRRRRRPREPLDVHLSVAFRFGDQPGEKVTVMDQVKVPMVDSVFKNRDRIIRGFVSMLMSVSLTQPKVLRELIPVPKLLRRR